MLGALRGWWRPAEMTVGDFQLPLAVLWVRDVQPLEGACVGGREGGSHGASQGDGEG